MASNSLRTLIEEKSFVTCPGVFDLVSAKLADRTKADALYMTGYGAVASYLGLPDAGLATYSQMLDRVQAIAQTVRKPLIADGDTGYGGLLNVHHTVRGYEKVGAAAIQLEDQQSPKKCGHTPNRHVIPVKEMINKLTVANDARSSRDFLIIARTDARTSLGIDEAIRRGEAYAKAGADIIFIESPESEAEMRKIGSALACRWSQTSFTGVELPFSARKSSGKSVTGWRSIRPQACWRPLMRSAMSTVRWSTTSRCRCRSMTSMSSAR